MENDSLPVNSGVESPLDRLTMIALRSQETASRALRQPDGDSAAIGALPAKVTRASLYLGFDSAGDPVALAAPAGTTAVTAFMATVLDDTTAAAARTTLGAAASADVLALAGGTMTGSILGAEGAAVTSAATTDIWAVSDGDTVHVTGTVTITSFGTAPQAGCWKKVVFDDALTLTHGANLFINNAAGNITTAANDWAFVYADTTTQMDVLFFKANGQSNATSLTLGTEQASTSGTSIDFTGIPAGTKHIVIMFVGVSTNGTSNLLVQIGDSGGVETATYVSSAETSASRSSSTAGFIATDTLEAAQTVYGTITLSLENSAGFTWVATGSVIANGGTATRGNSSAGSKSTSAELDRVRITTVNGTDAFDAGAVNIQYAK